MKRILHVVGARPNFMKAAPVIREMNRFPEEFDQILVHTGQHYDENMSDVFFDELDLPRPHVNLEVGSGSHAKQTAEVMMRFEPALLDFTPDWVIVPGDVNSTLACALVASKLGTKVAHLEAGLRSFDRTMPEEINRLLTDQISDLLLTPSRDGDENLLREGIPSEKIKFVGNVMIDTLVRLLPKAEARWQAMRSLAGSDRYLLVTLHRPSNVDNLESLREIILALSDIAQEFPVIFPVHPRTRGRIASLQNKGHLEAESLRIRLLEPLSYLDFLALQLHAAVLLTDSGGIQEETTFLGIPCLTARANTERPVTVTAGSNRLVKSTRQAIGKAVTDLLNGRGTLTSSRPELWDGRAAERIVEIFRRL